MSIIELDGKVKELRELLRMQEELTAEIEAIRNIIKAEMTAQGVDTLTGTDWKATWKNVTTHRVDSKALKAALPEVFAAYSQESITRRFTVA